MRQPSRTSATQWIALGTAAALALAVASFITFWPAPAWPSAFCQPISRVVGEDANAALAFGRLSLKSTPGVATVAIDQSLHDDVGEALDHAPTEQLRGELVTYQRATKAKVPLLELTTAVSDFDSRARTQLGRCGIVPIGR